MQSEYTELLQKLLNVQSTLTATCNAVATLTQECAAETEDVANISNAAYSELVALLKQLSNNNYCVKTLAEDAMQ